ncbi:MAG: hypothetical protein GX678_04230, partial [Actinomycetales bacterium]|nr:hypothetical protein [Actinomycetales bacterium]
MRHQLALLLRGRRPIALAIVDIAAWFFAFVLTFALRFETIRFSLTLDFNSSVPMAIPLYACLVLTAIASTAHLGLAWALRLHQGRHNLASFEELFTLTSVAFAAGAVTTLVNFFTDPLLFPRLSVLTATALAILMMVWPRVVWRFQATARPNGRVHSETTRVLIIGAGDGGRALVRSMPGDPAREWAPVAV